MKTSRFTGAGLAAFAGAIALTLSACSSGPQGDGANGANTSGSTSGSGSSASGTINGSGASSQTNAQQA